MTAGLNTYIASGTYGINAAFYEPTDLPSEKCSYGVLHVIVNAYIITQEIYGVRSNQNERYQRWSHDNGNTWSSWARVDNFGCNTLAELKAALANV